MQIGALAVRAGVGTTTIRYYESIGLLPVPLRTPNGYRRYTEADLIQLRFIRRAQAAGLSLRAIGDILAVHHAGLRPCRCLQTRAEQQIAVVDQQIGALAALRQSLLQLARQAERMADEGSCVAAEICSVLSQTTP